MTFSIGPEVVQAQLAATLAFADSGAGPSVIRMYATPRPAPGADPGGPAMADVVLGKPCGVLSAGALVLQYADPAGGMVLSTGIPRWARWVRSDGAMVADGTVTDAAHEGDFVVTGAVTPPGESSPTLYAGGRVLLGAVTLT